jgi:hypothetical protein
MFLGEAGGYAAASNLTDPASDDADSGVLSRGAHRSGVDGGHRLGAELHVGIAGLLGCFRGPPGRRLLAELQAREPAEWTPTATRALTSTPTPAIQWICQNPATSPTKAEAWAMSATITTAVRLRSAVTRANVDVVGSWGQARDAIRASPPQWG